MNGEKLFEDKYRNKLLPQEIIEVELTDIYSLLFPRIATIICTIPEAIRYWENEAWSENFTRLDEIALQLQKLFAIVNELDSHAAQSDEFLTMLRKSRAQKIGLDLDVTGLRADTIVKGKFDDFFVHPAIRLVQQEQEHVVASSAESFHQFIRPYQKTILIGAPGAGKSTWSKWLERQALTNAWTGIPIRIELRSIKNKKDMPITDVFNTIIGNTWSDEMTMDKIRNWSKANQILLIFDGFDEVRPSERDECLEWINDITLITKDCPVIITSRPVTTDHLETLNNPWQTWTILPFDNQRIIEYVNKWYAHIPLIDETHRSIDAEKLVSDWSDDPTIEPLTGNPLLLSTLLMVHQLDGRLPTGRAQLYRRYIEGMIGVWDDRRQILNSHISLDRHQKQQIMRKIALTMLLQEVDELDETDMVSIVASYLQQRHISADAHEVVYLLRERTGLIVGPGSYSFTHKSIAEYLVAELIIQGDQQTETGIRIDRFFLFQQRKNDRWNTVTFLWAGLTPLIELESFITECIDSKMYPLGYGLIFDQIEKLSPNFIKKSIESALTSDLDNINTSPSGWFLNQPENIIDQSHKTFYLNSIGNFVTFKDLVSISIKMGYLNKIKYEIHNHEFKLLLWSSVIFSTSDPDDIRIALSDTNFTSYPYWNFFKFSIISKRFIDEYWIRDIIYEFEYNRIIALFILHDIDTMILWYSDSEIPFDGYDLDTYFITLYNAYKDIPSDDIVSSMKYWIQYFSSESIDQILNIPSSLESIKIYCKESTYETIDKLIVLIDDLRSIRDSLIKETSE